jgi:NADPH:quinone reductase-like Zn-dependent oxidoreductase
LKQTKNQTMKALLFSKKTKPKNTLGELNTPIPKDDEVLIQVVTTSINAADYRSIKLGISPKKKCFGSAIAGTIEAVGKNVTAFKTQDEVLADLADSGFGGLAEYVAVPQDVVALKPANVSFEDAACLPVAATTALRALTKAHVSPKQHVLIVGSSGGVGTFAVQLAKHLGARVTAICSTANVAQSKALGADVVIDYKQENFLKSEHRYDAVLAINGGYPLSGYQKILKPKGSIVIVGGSLKQLFKAILFGWALSLGGKKIAILSAKSSQADLNVVADLMGAGKLRAVIEKRHRFNEAAEAMDELGKGHASGKVVINMANASS